MAGSGMPRDWIRDDPFYDNHTGTWLDPAGNAYIPRSGASPSSRMFSTSPYHEDRIPMPSFPYYQTDDFHHFPSRPMDYPWPSFESEFHHSRPQVPNSTSAVRRIPIQVVKHPVNVIPSTNASASQNSQVSAQTAHSAPLHPEHNVPAQSSHSPASSRCQYPMPNMSASTGHQDSPKWREWHHQRVPPEEQVVYQNSGTAPIFEQPPAPDGTAIPLRYQSLPNRPFVMTRDMHEHGGASSQEMRSDMLNSESGVSTPTEVCAQSSSSLPTSTPSEQIDQRLNELAEIRSQIDAFSAPTKDKTYLCLEDRLDKLLLKFDGIDTGGDDSVRQKRKQAVQETLNTITMLEKKLVPASEQKDDLVPATPTAATVSSTATGAEESHDPPADNKPMDDVETPTAADENPSEAKPSDTNEPITPVASDAPAPSESSETQVDNTDNQQPDSTATAEPAAT